MDSISPDKTGLSVIIVGAGIAGLAAATALAQKEHSVLVLESKPALNEFGASIGILSNGVRCLKAWGLQREFEEVVTKNRYLEIRDKDGSSIGHIPHNKNDAALIWYGDEIWNINRKDYQQVLAKAAEANGAEIMFDADIESVDVEKCIVRLTDGKQLPADVIVGADGMKSVVRRSIPALSGVELVPLKEAAFRCTVPKEKMRGTPKIEWLLNSGDEMCWTAPGRYVLAWPLPNNRPYDVVMCIKGRYSDVPAGRWGVKADPEKARKEFQDFCPEVRELLSHVDGCMEWTLAELPSLSTCKSQNGRVVLIGDAFHAMIPHSASGGNSSIEDAACVAECLDWSSRNGRDIAEATQVFEGLRKPRVERMQEASREGAVFLGAYEDFIPIRDQAMAEQTKQYDIELALPEDVRRAKPKAKPDMHARFPTEPYLQWLYSYDAIAVTKEHLAKV